MVAGVSVLKGIYLDHNATTPIHSIVSSEMQACPFGNPSSLHGFGQEAKRAMDRARERVAALINADPEEIIFTSGGTEADNLAIIGGALSREATRRRIVVSAIEHSAVLGACDSLSTQCFEITRVPADSDGLIDLQAMEANLSDETAILSVMLANHDLGTIQPVKSVARAARSHGILVHSDAVQAVGRIPVDVRDLDVDLLSISSHKLYGPKGVGALFVRRSVTIKPLLHGGPQERRLRAGTENLQGIVGFGMACELARIHMDARQAHARHLRDSLESGILGIPGTRLNGHPDTRLPNTANISFDGLSAEALLMNMDIEGIAVSTGAACQSEVRLPNPALLAIGRSEAEARSALRFSVGEGNTEDEIDRAIEVMQRVASRLRGKARP
jgi:cysteine desulfurase